MKTGNKYCLALLFFSFYSLILKLNLVTEKKSNKRIKMEGNA